MNEFERLLKSQQFRELPTEWRAEILDKGVEPTANEIPASWREWLWPAPSAWVAMAAVWVLIFTLQSSLYPDSGGVPAAPTVVTNSSTTKQQSAQTFHYTSTENPLVASLR